ncbi:phospholipase D-like domain-containing protein [Deltaproteobacteria bacterium TL4]
MTLHSKERLVCHGSSYYELLLNDINQARYHIDLETYIFDADPVGFQIAEALIKASQRKVRIRVLVDGAGSPFWGGPLVEQLEQAGVQTRVYHPPPWHLWQWSRAVCRFSTLLKLFHLITRVNRRNHRKTCIIDRRIAWVGSFNITQVHLELELGGKGWRDTAVRLSGIDLLDLQEAFDKAWQYKFLVNASGSETLSSIIRLNNTRKRRRRLYKDLLQKMKRARKRIWITNAYFVPDVALLWRLKKAARQKIDVRILLPKKSDVFFMPWASATFYESLMRSGVRIYEYLPGILHAKVMIIDNWMTVGSSNLNHRSLLHDFEVDVVLKELHSRVELHDQFLEDLKQSREINWQEWTTHNAARRFMGKLILSIKYWI